MKTIFALITVALFAWACTTASTNAGGDSTVAVTDTLAVDTLSADTL
jgi:hypothetical protein